MRTLALVTLVVGCSGDPAPAQIDATGNHADADDSATCLVKGAYGALGAITGTAGTASGATTVTVVLDPGPPGKDDLFIKLVAGSGVFAGGVAPGTYPIAGADAKFTTCGLCVNIIADIVTGQGPSKFYFASSGSVTLTSVTAPITGTVSDLAFTEIAIADGSTIPGCTASIASASFTAN
jgi:hypothetical protein